MGYPTAISDFWNVQSFKNLKLISTFFGKKNPSKFQLFKKKLNICRTIRATKNTCTKFQVIPFINVLFIAFWMKNDCFLGHLNVIPCISVYSFNSDFYATKCSKVIFRVLDEKPTHKHVLRRQITEIGNPPRDLWWPSPQKRSPRA